MTWADFYLICFLVGLVLSLLSFLGGSTHFHLPHLQGHHGGLSGAHGGHPGVPPPGPSPSPINFPTLTPFPARFRGTGHLKSHHSRAWLLPGTGVARPTG